MFTFCICINCEFYLSCWINKSLENFPANYIWLNKWNKINKCKLEEEDFRYLPTFLRIQLNISPRTYKSEPDIIHCDSFLEQPGNWIR
uniref:Uncharacterized protein n=1 Tax=Eustigmatophyceae sp. Chic 10/23 P-6w TaxID=1446905 RepID=A0A3R5U9I0_9STRA|nr:hypothetical protein Ycf34 [Eustigmatophyceae sp. Chic 10/23 P-6w]QAA11646.1 hypothetical protein Ycf34 [Eustigmatophyceae sp. Chic 10/23 P-6w]